MPIFITSSSLKLSRNSSRRTSFDRPWCDLQTHTLLTPPDPTPPCRKSLPLPLLTVLFHQFLSPVRRKKKTNRAPFGVEKKKRPKKVLLYQVQPVKIQFFCSYFLHQPVFTADGGTAVVVPTKNTTVESTTNTAAGRSSSSGTDEEHGCRGNQAEEKTHREGIYTHARGGPLTHLLLLWRTYPHRIGTVPGRHAGLSSWEGHQREWTRQWRSFTCQP